MNKLNREIYRENPTRYIEEWKRTRANTKNMRRALFWGDVGAFMGIAIAFVCMLMAGLFIGWSIGGAF